MREYETLYILRHDAAEDRMEKVREKIQREVEERSDGALLGFDDWGVKRLAYEIQKSPRGRMILVGYCSSPTVVAEVERELRFDDVVVRFMTRRLQDGVDVAARKKEYDTEAKAKEKAREEQREAAVKHPYPSESRGSREEPKEETKVAAKPESSSEVKENAPPAKAEAAPAKSEAASEPVKTESKPETAAETSEEKKED